MVEDISMEYCPHCGQKSLSYPHLRHWVCKKCGFDLYNNVAAAVGVILYTDNNQVLFEVRGKEPCKGMLTLPGGFTEPDESLETACLRESFEETGLKLIAADLTHVCSAPNTYQYKGITYKTCDTFYALHINFDELQLKPEESEVISFTLKSIKSEADINALPIAFVSTVEALKQWLKMKA